MAVQNGRIPTSTLAAIPARNFSHDYPGLLRADAAASFHRLAAAFEAEFDKPLRTISVYRPLSRQIEIFLERYTPRASGRREAKTDRVYQGRVYKLAPRRAPVAAPGRSNHGLALAADIYSGVEKVGSREHRWMNTVGLEHGWTWTEGKRIGEPWHRVYNPTYDKHRGEKPRNNSMTSTAVPAASPTTARTAAQIEEDELMAAKDDIIEALTAEIRAVPRKTWGIGGGADAPMIPKGEGEGTEYPATALAEVVRRAGRLVPSRVWRGETVGRRLEGGTEWPETTLGSMTDRIVRQQLLPLRGEVAGLTEAVRQLAQGQGVDMGAITAAAEKGAREGAAAVSAADVAERLTVQAKQ